MSGPEPPPGHPPEPPRAPEPAGTDGSGGPPEVGPAPEEGPGAPDPERPARRRRRRRLILGISGLVLVVVVAVVAWYEIEANPSGGPGPAVIVTVKPGEATSAIVSDLAAHGVVNSSLAFRISFIFSGTPSVQPGAYRLHENLSFSSARQILEGGPNVFVVQVLPGYTLHEVADAVNDLPGHSASSFTAVAKSGTVHSPLQPPGGTDLEGLLGTGTYLVPNGETDVELLTDMVERFDDQAVAAGVTPTNAAKLGVTPYEMVIVASIVQKEGYLVRNMPQVARVIYNRLADGTPLQMDSTILYSLGQDGGSVTPADLKIDTPYNTYLHAGLTPTPICIPSPAALAAGANPPAGDWRYFVVVDKAGTEAFADTYAQQQANEQLAQSRGVG